ncbi:ComEC/Rec2 family competence protein [Bacteroides sp. 224]|uniref:ComEC/Rec2 family competence protein n=1 Tax=Bacteroides sp. 224 TaxID=2302936 RepID=UPI00351BDBDB
MSKRYSLRWLFGASIFGVFFLLGCNWHYWKLKQTNCSFSEDSSVYQASIISSPEVKERSILCESEIEHQRVLLYFPKDSTVATLRRGDRILVSSQLSLPKNSGVPDAFDYRRYLLRKGISGTGYVADGHWKLLTHDSHRTLQQIASDSRDTLLSVYRQLGFTKDELSILSALTLGYKEDLSEEIRESFSVAGSSHILSLSGLHLMLVYTILLFMLAGLGNQTLGNRMFKLIVILIALWAFAFITGLSTSVVRATIMCSLLSLAQFTGHKNLSFNSMSAAAFFMLVYNPAWLFDVGFQLSFSAVVAILFIQPWLSNKVKVNNRALKYVWDLVTVSLAAQIGTAPLVLFYFSRFSTHFLLTNLLVIPLVSFIVYGAVLLLLLTPIPLAQQCVAWILKYLLSGLINIVGWVEKLPYSSIDHIWLHKIEVIGIYVILVLLGVFVFNRRAKTLILLLGSILSFVVLHAGLTYKNSPSNSMVFYCVRNCPAVHCISSSGKSWLSYVDSIPDVERLKHSASPYWNRLRLDKPKAVKENYNEGAFTRKDNMISFGEKRVAFINNNSWRYRKSEYPLRVDYLYLCKGYTGSVQSLTTIFNVKHIVLDASLPEYLQNRLRKECEALEMSCISLNHASYLIY